ncbi:GntR family transcriptional regulator [Psychrobium sp. nBUS_13]|uniref:GntR family transcriptional regulator n=1 Tax=Psychrobium sp. nBUS_13 TaxID=3395319 RepID=UPI003EB74742
MISPSSGVPIYKQLLSQIERMILNGYFAQGDSLPSVRQVATDLDINPMTVSKAYGLLEERGYVERLRGKGMIVAKRDEEVSEKEKLTMLSTMIKDLISEAQLIGVSQQQLLAMFVEQTSDNTDVESQNIQGKES